MCTPPRSDKVRARVNERHFAPDWGFRSTSAFGVRLLVIAWVLCAAGCGRPATEDECRIILRRAAELQLKGRLDASPEVVKSELDAIEASMKGAMMQKCVGKRITDSALECVKRARTSEQLLDECLD